MVRGVAAARKGVVRRFGVEGQKVREKGGMKVGGRPNDAALEFHSRPTFRFLFPLPGSSR